MNSRAGPVAAGAASRSWRSSSAALMDSAGSGPPEAALTCRVAVREPRRRMNLTTRPDPPGVRQDPVTPGTTSPAADVPERPTESWHPRRST